MSMESLDELRARNAAEEAETAKPPQAEVVEEEPVAEEEAAEETDEGADPDGEDEATESEPWMLSDEQASQEEAGQTFTGSDMGKVRRKYQAQVKESKSEIEELRAEIERMKAQGTQPVAMASVQIPKRPRSVDFDTDEEYEDAVDAWYDAKTKATVQEATSGQQHTAQQQAAKAAFDTAIDQHYERTSSLAEKHNITAEVMQQADLAVRTAVEQVMPRQGDIVTEQLIASIGEGSEKVMPYVGRSKARTAQLQQALLSDPSGMKAVAFLGKMSGEVNTPQQRNSRAPKPAKQLQGGASVPVSAEAKAMKKAYQTAVSPQAKFDARRAARQAGLDPSDW